MLLVMVMVTLTFESRDLEKDPISSEPAKSGRMQIMPHLYAPDEACLYPYKARPSPEGFGIDIMGLALKSGLIVQWPPEESVVLIGLILF